MDLPLFPLHAVLCPGVVLPLHIFEPRYREMVGRCLADDAPFGVVLIREGREVGPSVPALAGGRHAGRDPRGERVRGRPLRPADGRDDAVRDRGGRGRAASRTSSASVQPLPEAVDDTDRARELADRLSERFVDYLRLLRPAEGEDATGMDVQVEVEVREVPADEGAGADGDGPPGATREPVIPDDPTALSYLLSGIIQVELPRRQALLEADTTEARLFRPRPPARPGAAAARAPAARLVGRPADARDPPQLTEAGTWRRDRRSVAALRPAAARRPAAPRPTTLARAKPRPTTPQRAKPRSILPQRPTPRRDPRPAAASAAGLVLRRRGRSPPRGRPERPRRCQPARPGPHPRRPVRQPARPHPHRRQRHQHRRRGRGSRPAIIIAIVVMSALLGFVQEARSEAAVAALQARLTRQGVGDPRREADRRADRPDRRAATSSSSTPATSCRPTAACSRRTTSTSTSRRSPGSPRRPSRRRRTGRSTPRRTRPGPVSCSSARPS